MTDNVQDFPAMLRGALGDRLDADAVGFVDMLAEDAVMQFPFAPSGFPAILEGRSAIAGHLARLARLVRFDSIGPATLLACDGETAVLQFGAIGAGVQTGASYDQRYLSIVTTRGGRIIRYVDYWNPLALLRAVLGNEAIDALRASERYDG